jgi:hypothetical protein
MEIQISQEVVDTVCNSLRASRQSLRNQMQNAPDKRKETIALCQLREVEKALEVFEFLES